MSTILSKLATDIANDIEEMHRIQNAERIEIFCRDLASSYHEALSKLDILLSKHDALRFLAPGEVDGLNVLVQQGLVLVQETTEQALIERQNSLAAAIRNYLHLLATHMARMDRDLETQRVRLRSRLSVLYTLSSHLPAQEPLVQEMETLDQRISDLSLAPFAAESWKGAAAYVHRLVEKVAAKLEDHLSPETVDALAELTRGQAVPLTHLGMQSLKELLGLPVVAEQLVIQMRVGGG